MLKDETLTQKLINKGFWLYLFTFMIAPTGYIVRVILSNDLTVEEVGIIYSIISLFNLVLIFNDFGVKQGFNYFLPKYRIAKQYNELSSVFYFGVIFQIITSVILCILLFSFSGIIAEYYFQSDIAEYILQIFILYFFFLSILQVIQSMFVSFQNVFAKKMTEFIQMISIMSFIIILFLCDYRSVATYAWARSIATLLGVIVAIFFYYKEYFNCFSLGKSSLKYINVKKFFSFSLSAIIGTQALVLIKNIDQQMVLYFLGTEQAGYYTNFFSLIGLISFGLAPILGMIFPIVSELYAKKLDIKVSLLVSFLYKYFITGAAINSVLLFIFGEALAVVFFGESYIFSGTLIKYLAFFGIFKIIFMLNLSVLMGMGYSKKRTFIVLRGLVFSIIANFLLIPIHGSIGAALATGLSWLIIAIWSTNILREKVKIIINRKFYSKNLLLLAGIGTLFYFMAPHILILDDTYRYSNLMYLGILFISFLSVLMLSNQKEIKYFITEIQGFRKEV